MHVQGLMADVHSQTLPAHAGPLPSQDATQAERLELLLGRCAQRDERALQELYQLISGQLLGVLMRILRRRAVAEEALQDVMVKIWERADQYVAYRGREFDMGVSAENVRLVMPNGNLRAPLRAPNEAVRRDEEVRGVRVVFVVPWPAPAARALSS